MLALRSDVDSTADGIANTFPFAAPDSDPHSAAYRVFYPIADRIANAVTVAAAANVGTYPRANRSSDTDAHDYTDGLANAHAYVGAQDSADGLADVAPNCTVDAKPNAVTHAAANRIAISAANAVAYAAANRVAIAAYAVPNLRIIATLIPPFHDPHALSDVLPEPRTDDSDPEPVAFYRAHPTHAHYHPDGRADATHAYIGAHLASTHAPTY
jgi:hypothetical protein